MKLTKEQLKQIIKEELAGLSETYDGEDETYTDPRDLWMHKYSNLIIGAMRQIGIPPDVIRPSEVLKLAIGLIDEFGGDIELAKKVAKAGGQQQSAHDYGDDSE
jgi:hypothetical protein